MTANSATDSARMLPPEGTDTNPVPESSVESDGGWPEPRPAAWRALAAVDWLADLSGRLGDSFDAVLIYHSVGGITGADYAWNLTGQQFRAQLRMLSARFELVDFPELVEESDRERKRVAVTFDDGFRNFYDVAAPILREMDVPATVFVCPEFLGDDNADLLRERHCLGPDARDVMMTADQVRELAEEDGFSVGNHTATHPDLGSLPDREAVVEEVVGAKQALEDCTGVTVDRFSYPHGDVDPRAAEVVAETHEFAVTSEPSLVDTDPDPHHIPRLDACQPPKTLCFEVTALAHRIRETVRKLERFASS